MAEEIDPQLPFVQVSRGSAAQAAQLAPALGITYQHARGALLLLWEGLAQRRLLADALSKGGAVVLTDADCRLRLKLAFGCDVEPALAAAAGFLEPKEGGSWRVRGMSRYLTAERTRLGRKGGATPTPPPRRPGGTRDATPAASVREGGPTPHTLDVRRETEDVRRKTEEEKPEAASPQSVLREIWNDNRGPLPEWRHSKHRDKSARERLKEEPDVQVWLAAITKLSKSAFATGKNDRGWRADPEFLLRPGTLTKILEGKYDGSGGRGVLAVDEHPETFTMDLS